MIRLTALILLAGAGVVLSPGIAPAQFGPRFGPYGPTPVIVPSVNPFFYVPQYRYSYGTQLSFSGPAGNFSFSTRSYYYGVNPYPGYAYSTAAYMQSGSYMTGGASARPNIGQQAANAVAQGQREASRAARDEISGQWNYETGAAGTAAAGPQGPPDALRKALAASNPAEIASGEALNEVLKEIIRIEAKGAKGASAYIPPLLLDDVRFAGSPSADLLNFARRADNLEFPPAFDDPALAALRPDLARDFAAAAAPVQAAKAPEAGLVAKLDLTYQRVQDASGPVVKNLPFEEASAARRFLNRMAGAIKGMKGTAAVGLIDPKWAVEGLTVADLVKHMTKHKLFFAPAPRGSEEAYAAMHRNFVTYLFVLNQSKK